MFERYTEKARRVISHARHEALAASSGLIEAEHLLLGLLTEDEILLRILPREAPEAIRVRIGRVRRFKQPISASTDLPLSDVSKNVLEYSAEEAERLGHPLIDCGHLTLGLLRTEDCTGVSFLRKCGINTDSYRPIVSRELEETIQVAPWLGDAIASLEKLVERTKKHLKRYADVYGEQQPQTDKPWTRKQALGHLVDCAAAHHVWLARALTEPKLAAGGYPPDSWVSAQKYENYVWQEIVDLWAALNLLLIHVLAQVPEAKLGLECRIGSEEPIPLSKLIERYVEHCEETASQILA